ncbi:MAG: prephenate dehydrogenase/arogenate dehydrogenase family protein [SAR202 cluster bacterium]|nr:prephenate dehydrogenase/arogenate dehydrogenase family protein [SAR202 cluster bacterium]HJO60172.1 prephenate dehydrogenase/arogenate dehydrogenase family protein [SAR202 cluster bacterium]
MERITVVGMGALGASLGLALKNIRLKNTEVIGHCLDRKAGSEINKIEAFDALEGNLKKAIEGAQLIVLDYPINESRDLFESIGSFVSDGAVVTDMRSSKKRSAAWAEEFLPGSVSYVGGRPIIKTPTKGIGDSSPNLFDGVNYCVIPSKSADDQATKTVVGLAESIGAKPYFLDVDEHDSYSAAMDHLPYLISTAFVNATSSNASWREMHKSAGSLFDMQSTLSANDPTDTEADSLTMSEPLIYWVDQMILSLHKLRTELQEDSESFIESFIHAWEQRARWEAGVVGQNSDMEELPSAAESMASAFLGDKLARRVTKMGDANKKESWRYPRSR